MARTHCASGSSCFTHIECLLEAVDAYGKDDLIDKATYVANAKSRMFTIMAALISNPLGDNMALPFAHTRNTDAGTSLDY
jgi:hypothetical protein